VTLTGRRVAVVVSLAVACGRPLAAQSPEQTLSRAVVAYQNLEFDLAAGLLRRVLSASGSDTLATASRPRALAYLGASEWFRGHRDSSAAVFRRLVLLDPRYQPDELVFPPDVTNAFAQARRDAKVVAVRAAPELAFQLGEGRYSAWLLASSSHEIAVTLVHEDGTLVRSLYRGPIGDSLEVVWDGNDSTGAVVRSGTYLVRVASHAPDGHTLRVAQARLDVAIVRRDTLPVTPVPPDSLVLPEMGPARHPLGSLFAGLLGSVTVAALPAALASGSHPTDARFAVAGAVGLAGLVGFFTHQSRPLPQNVAANRALRDTWGHRAQAAAEENARRRKDVHVVVRTGRVVVIDGESL